MKQKIEEKIKAIKLREKGYSLNEIVLKVGVAKSSVSEWVRNVVLTNKARKRLLTKIQLGPVKAAENKKKRIQEILDRHSKEASKEISCNIVNKFNKKLICALLYWCEGAKDHYGGVRFTNSDPQLVKIFVKLFRETFFIQEEKLRVSVHLHEYHNKNKQISFWSKITGIPKKQFIRPYLKPNTGKRIKKDYPGCITVYYYNTDVGRQLLALAKAFLNIYGGIG